MAMSKKVRAHLREELRRSQAGSIGRSFSISEDDEREEFIDWLDKTTESMGLLIKRRPDSWTGE